MSKLLWYMLKEEWRIHSTMFGNVGFALFPFMIFAVACMGSFLLPYIRDSLPAGNISLILHSNYLLLGFMAGAFGLLGNEAMNRRFGQASLIAYAIRTLPLTDRRIFGMFVLKDTLYYFILWIFPFAAGFFVVSQYRGLPLHVPILLFGTLTLSFLMGLGIIFFLSTVYIRSKRVLLSIIFTLTSFTGIYVLITKENPALLFPPVMLIEHFSLPVAGLTTISIIVLFSVSLILFRPENAATSRHYKNQLYPLKKHLSFLSCPALIAKEIIDLYRSGGAIGQMIFSFFLPLMVIWFFLSLTSDYLPVINLLFLFSITTGVIASTMYTWLTAFDNYQTYSHLPISVPMVIMSKVQTFSLLQIIPVLFIVSITIIAGQILYLVPVVVLCLSIKYFALSVTIWLTGLNPTVLVYDIKVIIRYFALLGLVCGIFSTLSFTHPYLALTSVILIIPARILIKRGCIIWEQQEQPMY